VNQAAIYTLVLSNPFNIKTVRPLIVMGLILLLGLYAVARASVPMSLQFSVQSSDSPQFHWELAPVNDLILASSIVQMKVKEAHARQWQLVHDYVQGEGKLYFNSCLKQEGVCRKRQSYRGAIAVVDYVMPLSSIAQLLLRAQ